MKKLLPVILIAIIIAACTGVSKKTAEIPTAGELNDKGVMCLNQQNFDSALVYFNLAIAADSGHYNAHSNKIALHIRLKQFDEALKEGQILTALHPDQPQGWVIAGSLLEITGDSVSAQDYYAKSIAIFDRLLADTAQAEFFFNNRLNRAFSLNLMDKEEGREEMIRLKNEYPQTIFPDSLVNLSHHDFLLNILQADKSTK